MTDCPHGFRLVGATWERRRLVDAAAAFSAYATCDDRAEIHQEAYLSAFQFGREFREHLEATGSTADYAGTCWSLWVWFDLDGDDLEATRRMAARLCHPLCERYGLDDDRLLIFFSGARGFHVGLPTSVVSPTASSMFHRVARQFAEKRAEATSVTIDRGVYDRVRAFRAPNSRHSKSGLHKRRFSLDELTGLKLERLLELAREPQPFELPPPLPTCEQAIADWREAVVAVEREIESKRTRRATGSGATLNRATLDFIRHGASPGDRHRLLFSASANLAEFACPPELAHALLTEAALDSGLPPREVRRQITCGLNQSDGENSSAEFSNKLPTVESSKLSEKPTPSISDSLRRLWDGQGTQPRAASERDGEIPVSMPLADPPPLWPLPTGTMRTGTLETPCRCGATEYAEIAITEGRTRIDCRGCHRFLRFGVWTGSGEAS